MENRAAAAANQAKEASHALMGLSFSDRNHALANIAKALDAERNNIFRANELDLAQAAQLQLKKPLLDRLKFDAGKLSDVLSGINDLCTLPDPLGRTTYQNEMDVRLELYRVTCPIGVIGVIFESRPDALVQISMLGLKSGNAIILKGGSEAQQTNQCLFEIIHRASRQAGLPEGWIQLLYTRDDVIDLLVMDDKIDLLIPRGSNAFVRSIMDQTRIPVLGHADGVCHIYADEYAAKGMTLSILSDSKTQYVSACNAAETLLIHRRLSHGLLFEIKDRFQKEGVSMYGCPETCRLLGCEPVEDWHTEYLDRRISIRIVDSLDEAVRHINQYGSGHTDAIITENTDRAKAFMSFVDSANVFWNCSTRFSDGFRYGFGAEVGISTSKIHARGPVGLEGLVTYKYKLFGNGQTVADYAGGAKQFIHRHTQAKSPFDDSPERAAP